MRQTAYLQFDRHRVERAPSLTVAPEMFSCAMPRMPPEQRRVLFQSEDKVRNMVNSVARYFANVLQIVDDEISEKQPLVEICRREVHYYLSLTSHGGVEQMGALMKMYDFVQHCDDLAMRMRQCAMANYGHNIDINPFTSEVPYYHSDQLIDERTNYTTINVGDVGNMLMLEVNRRAIVWLDELDKVLCDSSTIQRTDAGSRDDTLLETKKELAYAIAERLTMMSLNSVSDDCMSSRSLEAMLNRLYEREMPHAHCEKERDEHSVRVLLGLATDPAGGGTRNLLENDLGQLREIAAFPPMEVDESRKQIDLDRLSRAFAEDMDIEVRVAMVTFWADNSRKAVGALQEALRRVEKWRPIERVSTFSGILRNDSGGRASNTLMIPPMTFLETARCFACKQPARRSGLSEAGQRAELMIRSVWEMASKGHFMSGVLAADAVIPVTLDCIVFARMAAKTIADERDMNKLGFRVCAFVSALYDMEGDHVRALDDACCYLSRFSCQELETVFDSSGDLLPLLCGCLTNKTRHYMSYKPNDTYKSYVTDSIGMLLPILHQRRNRLGVPVMMRSNGLLDVLRTIPKFNSWTPTNGTLTLTLDDIRSAHRTARTILDDLHENGVVVSRSGAADNKRKIRYSFDTMMLWKLISEYGAVCATGRP